MTKQSRDIYQETTDKIVAAIEAGTPPWAADWIGGGQMPTRSTGDHYRGINVLLLQMTAMGEGYANPHWLTFNQAKALGGMVRKGEKGTGIVFFKAWEKDAPDHPRANDDGKVTIPCLRSYTVFNAEQIDGLPDGKYPAPIVPEFDNARDNAAEAAMRSCGATITERGAAAFYDRSADAVTLPDFERFQTVRGYLATMAHELVHWTGAPHRLARTKGSTFGDADYAFEELVAEIGASFIGARLGFTGDHFESHASYVASWLRKLRGDKKYIFKAAALAQTAADMVLENMNTAPADIVPAAQPPRVRVPTLEAAPMAAAAAPMQQLELI